MSLAIAPPVAAFPDLAAHHHAPAASRPPALPVLPGRRCLRPPLDFGAGTYRVALAVAAGWPCGGCGRVVGGGEDEGMVCGTCEAMSS